MIMDSKNTILPLIVIGGFISIGSILSIILSHSFTLIYPCIFLFILLAQVCFYFLNRHSLISLTFDWRLSLVIFILVAVFVIRSQLRVSGLITRAIYDIGSFGVLCAGPLILFLSNPKLMPKSIFNKEETGYKIAHVLIACWPSLMISSCAFALISIPFYGKEAIDTFKPIIDNYYLILLSISLLILLIITMVIARDRVRLINVRDYYCDGIFIIRFIIVILFALMLTTSIIGLLLKLNPLFFVFQCLYLLLSLSINAIPVESVRTHETNRKGIGLALCFGIYLLAFILPLIGSAFISNFVFWGWFLYRIVCLSLKCF